MSDLHGWITQRIDTVEAAAREATEGPWFADHPEPRHWGDDPESALIVRGKVLCILDNQYNGPLNADHIVLHSPAAVLRRCEADRRILARHRLNPDAYWSEAAACHGCGTFGDCDDPVTDNLNDCPELLDLAHAHGLTDEILASLDRPQKGERSDPGPGFGMPDVFTESLARLYADMHAAIDATLTRTIDSNGTGEPRGIIAWRPVEPTPMERALHILDADLRACPLYRPEYPLGGVLPSSVGATADRPPALRGPNWKARP